MQKTRRKRKKTSRSPSPSSDQENEASVSVTSEFKTANTELCESVKVLAVMVLGERIHEVVVVQLL